MKKERKVDREKLDLLEFREYREFEDNQECKVLREKKDP